MKLSNSRSYFYFFYTVAPFLILFDMVCSTKPNFLMLVCIFLFVGCCGLCHVDD